MDDNVNLLGFMQQYVLPFNNQKVRAFECLPKLTDGQAKPVCPNANQQNKLTSHYNLRPENKLKPKYQDSGDDSDHGSSQPQTTVVKWPLNKKLPRSLKLKQGGMKHQKTLLMLRKSISLKNAISCVEHKKRKAIHMKAKPAKTGSDVACSSVPIQNRMPQEHVGQFSFETLKEELSRKNGSESSLSETSNQELMEFGSTHETFNFGSESITSCLENNLDQSKGRWCFEDRSNTCAIQGEDVLLDDMNLQGVPVKEEPCCRESLAFLNTGNDVFTNSMKTEHANTNSVHPQQSSFTEQDQHAFFHVAQSSTSNDFNVNENINYGDNPPVGQSLGNACCNRDLHERLREAIEAISKLESQLDQKNKQLREYADKFKSLTAGFLELSTSFQEFANNSVDQ